MFLEDENVPLVLGGLTKFKEVPSLFDDISGVVILKRG